MERNSKLEIKNAKLQLEQVVELVDRSAYDACPTRGRDSIDKLFADLRKREEKSGHPVVNLQTKRRKP